MAETIPFTLKAEVCSVIQDTGFIGNPSEYIKTFYGKAFEELTTVEAEMIVRQLGTKPGCLYEGDPKNLIPIPRVEEEDGSE